MGRGRPPPLKPDGHTAPYEPELPEWRRQPGTPQPALTNGGDFSCQPHCPTLPLLASSPWKTGAAGEGEEINDPMSGVAMILGLGRGKGLGY